MPASRLAASVLIVVHLTSVASVALIREPREAAPAEDSRAGSPLDAFARGIQVANDAVWQRTLWLRPLTDRYVRLLAIHQRWSMFARSSQSEEYIRVSFVMTGGQRVVDWLVYPSWRPDRVRGVEAFRDSYLDKTFQQVILGFAEKDGPQLLDALIRRRRLGPGEDRDLQARFDAAAQDFQPVVRYYAKKYRRNHLSTGESIARAEVWYGVAAIPPPEETAALDRQARNKVLAPQFDGPVSRSRKEQPALGAQERQAGIVWTLYYIGTP